MKGIKSQHASSEQKGKRLKWSGNEGGETKTMTSEPRDVLRADDDLLER